MSWLSKLFGGGGQGAGSTTPTAPTTDYQGYRITPEPIPEEGQFRLAARIEAEVNGETRHHHLIRADLIRDFDDACDAAIAKAKQTIDQMGARIFD